FPRGTNSGERQLQLKQNGGWHNRKDCDVHLALTAIGLEGPAKAKAMHAAINEKPLWGEYMPFGPDDLGNGIVNMAGECWAVPSKAGPTPNFDSCLAHVGQGLDLAVAADNWCRENDILNGGDYLL